MVRSKEKKKVGTVMPAYVVIHYRGVWLVGSGNAPSLASAANFAKIRRLMIINTLCRKEYLPRPIVPHLSYKLPA